MIRDLGRLVVIASVLSLSGCSVDEYRNLQRKSRAECDKAGGTYIADKYCYTGAPKSDAGPDGAVAKDAAQGDAAQSDAASADAEVYRPCKTDDETQPCYEEEDQKTSRQPPCRAGLRTCHDGVFGDCEDQVRPKIEMCNGEDDDCDGRVDELGSSPCDVPDTLGLCQKGERVCVSGQFSCIQLNYPQSDACNGDDDDCDGETDEKTERGCYPTAAIGCELDSDSKYSCVGLCRAGTLACVDGDYEESCGGSVVTPASADSCTRPGESNSDEDCDGKTDEGCACSDGVTCYTGFPLETQDRAPCHAGSMACTDPTNGACENEEVPHAETCANSGVDDDCDGEMDNIPLVDTSCAEQSDKLGACKAGALWRCMDNTQTCVPAAMAAERCDGRIDEDCDGNTDEGFDLMTDRNNCGACGVVCAANLQCCGGHCVNLNSSADHCSRCGNSCDGLTCCNGACVNTINNTNHCGRCGSVCGGLLPSCNNGGCGKLL